MFSLTYHKMCLTLTRVMGQATNIFLRTNSKISTISSFHNAYYTFQNKNSEQKQIIIHCE